ncbi:MAG: glycosyltransferase family 4 protein [Candidatus Thorarchaeota archaeon]
MRIIFDLRKVGLGNNGGSLTLVKSGNTLVNMGHDVFFIDSGRNQHTWTGLKARHMIVKNVDQIPDAQMIIATGYKSVAPTLNAPSRCGIKAHWIRGWETWQMPEKEIVKKILKVPTLKLVNSFCLQSKLKKYNVDSTIIRPGYDLDEIYPLSRTEARKNCGYTVVGGLYTEGKHISIKRTKWIFDVAENLKKRYKNILLFMFGAPKRNTIPGVDVYFNNPTKEDKLRFYNQIDFWLAPASQEGLHMPPAEAMMTGCPVVATNAEMSGTQDYMVDEVTGLISKNNFKDFLKCSSMLCSDQNLRKKLGREARKKIEELGDRKQNMQKLIDLIAEKNYGNIRHATHF